MSPTSPAFAFGVTASARTDAPRLGTELERLGYEELWTNDTTRRDGLATLAAVAPGTVALRFGVGVVALSEQSPARVVERVAEAVAAGLPLERVTLGVGSGASSSLALVRGGVAELRRLLPDTPVAVAAVGPRMASLGGELADAVVGNWATPERFAWLRDGVAEGAALAGRPSPRLVGYVRAAVGPGAADRLAGEMERYRRRGRHYLRAFADQPPELIGAAGATPAEVQAALQPYRAVLDTLVVRGLPVTDDVDAWLEIARAAAGA